MITKIIFVMVTVLKVSFVMVYPITKNSITAHIEVKKENAENYIKENGGTLEIESATPQEYFNLDFSDPIKEDYF